MKKITSAQIRAGRALIRWTASDLARAAKIGIATVRRAEADEGEIRMTEANLSAVVSALESAGVLFISENGGGPGVRLRR
nr:MULTISPECIES: transcriptional regulator [unclassified Martelella]